MMDHAPLTWGDIVLAVNAYARDRWPDKEIESIGLPCGKSPGYVLFRAQKSADWDKDENNG